MSFEIIADESEDGSNEEEAKEISKIKKDLKFKPKHNLLVGLKKFNEFLDDGSKK